ncbi:MULTISPECIES: tripartite tricarboxylate transporter permease [Pacificibacter]|uniref:tripartite tricarboxylate transporter permease n=1 Tax=Pacificibacter TaxID=1042323 RepID=UPI001C0A5362|nr:MULTISPECIES: tripartite tricarboxylate transporter permease [Pacificibacter]MBU2937626.1 tripartite tricarboxylate transporter permease [Pacificibacter marinus]MDO6616921.1 tripartite tricarboxylate transporter permease [Pacificibacter sp. 1_MG-2023]
MLLTSFIDVLLGYLSSPLMLGLVVLGTVLGLVLGAIPGISSTMALAILMPVTFTMEPGVAMLFLISVFMSSVYGGSISAILMKLPGTPASIFTQIDGYPMAQQGRAGHALNFALVSSTIGGMIGLAMLVLLAPVLAEFATNFRSPEFAAVALFGIVMLSFSSNGSTLVASVVGFIGVILGMVGFDALTDAQRMTLNTPMLQSGLNLVPMIIGLFGLGEILQNLVGFAQTPKVRPQIGKVMLPLNELTSRWKVMLRGSVIGTFIGAIPAAGSAVAVSIAYAQERRLSKTPEKFGTGHADGIVAPEAANSASVGGSLIPLIALGVPGDTITAVLMGALMLHGLTPGPLLFANNPTFVAWIYVSVLLALIATLVVGLGMIRAAVLVTRIPPQLMYVFIAVFCVIGAFAIRNDMNDVYVMIAFGVVGFVFSRLSLPVTPMAFGLILGPILEENLRRSLMISRGSWSIFLERPISAVLILICVFLISIPLLKWSWVKLRAL